MFKRVERKRKRRDEVEELGLDDDIMEMMGLDDTDSDNSDSDSGQDSAQSGVGEDEVAMSEDQGSDDDPLMSVEEALKDPIYLVSLNPTVHRCIMCKGKLIKNAWMATAHRNAKGHERRFENFKRHSAHADPCSDARELLRAIQSASGSQKMESQEPPKRALKRQAKQAAIREKRKHHKELKVKAIAKKALKKSTASEGVVTSEMTAGSQSRSEATRKKQKLGAKTSTGKNRDVALESASHTKTSSNNKKSVFRSRIKSKKKSSNPS